MLKMSNNTLLFSFPEVHPDAKCTINLIRTLRIPDARGTVSRLPPGLGVFPLRHVEDFKDKLDEKVLSRGGVALPMYPSEALYVQFTANRSLEHGVQYPFAVKVGTGRRSAITGKEWSVTLREGDYVMIPKQPWLDGFADEEGFIRQFVAMALGGGVTVEEQITGKAEFGGIQIEVFPMKADEFVARHPKRVVFQNILRAMSYTGGGGGTYGSSAGFPVEEKTSGGLGTSMYSMNSMETTCNAAGASDHTETPYAPPGVYTGTRLGKSDSETPPHLRGDYTSIGSKAFSVEPTPGQATLRKTREERADHQGRRRGQTTNKVKVQSMGMAAGGMMEQKIFADTYGLEVWDLEHTSRTFVHLFNSMAWRGLTGMDPPTAPRTAADYARHNLPWFTHYDEGVALGGTKELFKVKSVAEIEAETGMPLLPENEPCTPTFVVKIQKPGVSSGTW